MAPVFQQSASPALGLPAARAQAAHQAAQAQQLLAAGQIAPAEALLRPLLTEPATRGEALYLLTVAAVMAGRAEDAVARGHDAVATRPGDPRCHFALGRACKLAGQLRESEAAYRRAIALDPRHAEAHVSLGIALKNQGRLEEAIQAYEQALALQPGLAAAMANLAYARAAVFEKAAGAGTDEPPPEQAIDDARRAAQLDSRNPQLHFNLGLLLRRARRRAEAIDAFNRALGLVPGDLGYCLHLGHELTASGNTKQAAVLYERWQDANPPSPVVMRALADLLTREGEASQGLVWSERAARLDADPRAYLALCHAYQQARRLPAALEAGHKAIAASGQSWEMYSIPLMVANYLLEDAEPILQLHADFGRALAAHVAADPAAPKTPPLRRERVPGEPLRVGLVSSDFIQHSVAFFMGPLMEHHDRSRLQLHCYYGRGWGDSMTERFKAQAHRWVDCEHLSDAALLRRIRADGIDILIDLSGHTSGARLRVFAMGAAPLQLGYLGYPTISGVPGMHHRMSDATIDPGDLPALAEETPLCLPGSMFCYRPPEAPAIGPVPQLDRGVVTFGSFNNLAKLSDHTLDLWAQVMQAVPGSRLLLKAASAADAGNRKDIEDFMAARGVAASRLDLRPRLEGRSGHLSLYNEVDVGLDTFPYNGATTTCEALWMGVPVVTRSGRTHTSRMGASILRAAGLQRWVAQDDAGFVTLAVGLAQDLPARQAWRDTARAQLQRSSLMDERRFVADFDALLWRAWQAAGAGEAAAAGLA